jgi:LysM repeat protein
MEYKVQPGDTLSQIAVDKDVNMKELIELNEIDDPNMIRSGSVLQLPGADNNVKPGPNLKPTRFTETNLTNFLRLNEGEILETKYDEVKKDRLTVGIGRLVIPGVDRDMYGNLITRPGQMISRNQAEEWFSKDIAKAVKQASTIPGFDLMSPNRQIAMIDLTYNMGFGWTTEFKNAMKHITAASKTTNKKERERLFGLVADELEWKDGTTKEQHSDWWIQVKSRAPRVTGLVRNG